MQVVHRALATLKALAPEPAGLTLAELATRLDVPQGSMHRMLAVLEKERFVTRSPSNRRYFLGSAALLLNDENARRDPILVTPHPALTAAAVTLGETVFLTEIVGDRAVCIGLAESSRPLRLFVRIGQDMPLHASAAARVLLAHRSQAEIERLLVGRQFDAFTPETPTTMKELLDHLALVRAQGFDICDEELDPGVWAVGYPVFASTGRVIASITAAAPAHRVASPDARSHASAVIQKAAGAMSADLGWVDTSLRRPASADAGARNPAKKN